MGLEDCVHISPGILAESSAQMVEKVIRVATEMGRAIASPAETRQLLSLCSATTGGRQNTLESPLDHSIGV